MNSSLSDSTNLIRPFLSNNDRMRLNLYVLPFDSYAWAFLSKPADESWVDTRPTCSGIYVRVRMRPKPPFIFSSLKSTKFVHPCPSFRTSSCPRLLTISDKNDPEKSNCQAPNWVFRNLVQSNHRNKRKWLRGEPHFVLPLVCIYSTRLKLLQFWNIPFSSFSKTVGMININLWHSCSLTDESETTWFEHNFYITYKILRFNSYVPLTGCNDTFYNSSNSKYDH